MFSSVEFIRELCRKKNIPVSQLEKDCGFSNGYLNPKKLKKIPFDRAQTIGKYLNVSTQQILCGEEEEPEHDILDDVDVAFYGDYRELNEDDKETLRTMARIMRDRHNKKSKE